MHRRGRLQERQRGYRERLQPARRSALTSRIIDLAFEQSVSSAGNLAEALAVTYAGAADNIAELVRQRGGGGGGELPEAGPISGGGGGAGIG